MYYGSKAVKNIDGTNVEFEDGFIRGFTETSLKYSLTEEQTDENYISDIAIKAIVEDIVSLINSSNLFDKSDDNIKTIHSAIFEILLKHDVRIGVGGAKTDIDQIINEIVTRYTQNLGTIFNGVSYSINEVYKMALVVKLWKYDKAFPLDASARDITINDLIGGSSSTDNKTNYDQSNSDASQPGEQQ